MGGGTLTAAVTDTDGNALGLLRAPASALRPRLLRPSEARSRRAPGS